VVDIKLADDLPRGTRQLVEVLRRDIIDGRFNPFDGEEHLSSRDIIMMDRLCPNVIGEIPPIDALTDEAQSTVKYSGVESAKRTR
jgi:hypothetical protein